MPAKRLFLVLFFIFFEFFILFFFLFLFGFVFILFFFVVLFIEVIGNRIEMHGMRLGHFQFRFTLWAAQDFALLDFVLIHIYFGATIGAANHGTILRKNIRGAEPWRIATATDHRIIYRERGSQSIDEEKLRQRKELEHSSVAGHTESGAE